MNRSRQARTRRITAIVAALLALIFVISACGGNSEGWTPTNLTGTGNVEQVACDQIDSAKNTVNEAESKGDTSTLATIGLWVNGKLDENALNEVRDRLDKWKEKCSQGPPPTTTSSVAAVSDCVDEFVVKLDANVGGSLFSEGISPKSEDAKREILAKAKEDPRVLQVYYNASPRGQKTGTIQKAEDIAPLQNGACYTEQGRKWYASWAADWELVEIRNDTLPAYGTNTGAVPNGQAFQSQGAIPAGTAYLIVQYDATGKEIGRYWIRIECGNPVGKTPFPGIGGPPPGAPPIVTVPPTGGPPPTEPPPTEPPPVITTTPPPPPPIDDKVPTQAPIHDGGTGVVTAPVSPPTAGQPSSVAPAPQPPPAPVVVTPPPVITQQPQPTGQPTQTVAPSTQPPNNGTVVPIPGGDFG